MIKTSKGEQKVINLLKRGGIKFEREISFSDLNGYKKVPLRFDFGIFDNYGKLKCCIEVDGRQHYEYVPYFHKTIFGFKKQQEWDRRKNKYCITHNIPLYRIPYWDIDNLTLKTLFNPQYRVFNQFHLDFIRRCEVKK